MSTQVTAWQWGAGTVLQEVQKSTYRRFGSLSQGFNKSGPDCVTTDLWIPGEKMWCFLCHGGLLKQSVRTDSVPPHAWTSNPSQAAHQGLLDPHVDSTVLEPEAEQHLQCSVTSLPVFPFPLSLDKWLREVTMLYREKWMKRKSFWLTKRKKGKNCEGKSERRTDTDYKGVQGGRRWPNHREATRKGKRKDSYGLL